MSNKTEIFKLSTPEVVRVSPKELSALIRKITFTGDPNGVSIWNRFEIDS